MKAKLQIILYIVQQTPKEILITHICTTANKNGICEAYFKLSNFVYKFS